MAYTRSRFALLILLLLGVAAWPIVFGLHNAPLLVILGSLGASWLICFLMIVAGLGFIPATARPIDRSLEKIRSVSPRARLICSFLAGVFSTAYLFITAWSEHRQFFPYMHDEYSYLTQAHQFARGRLWMPAHPLASFFDSFQLFTKPVYASAYFPGTAFLYVPGIWLHLQPFVTSLLIAGAIAGILFWITAEILDPVAAVLAVLLLLSDGLYRQLSIMTLGQPALLLYGLSATVACLKWRTNKSKRSAIAIGFFLALATVTRPVDALCFAVPIGLAVLLHRPSKVTVPAIIAGATPLICLQLILNRGVTGRWLQTPFRLYADNDYPGTAYGFHPFDPSSKPISDLPQKIAIFQQYKPLVEHHQLGNALHDLIHWHLRLALSQSSTSPFPLLVLLLPVAFLAMNRQRAVLLAPLPLLLLLYVPYPFFFAHYVFPVGPAVIVGILLGVEAIVKTYPARRRFLTVGSTLLIAGMAIAALPQWQTWNEDAFSAGLLESVNHQLAALPHTPAVVLFSFDPNRNLNEEPVYNADVAWPDDAPIIRAHDCGDLNQQIFDYYADRQPYRYFYRFNERDRSLHKLGLARELGHEIRDESR